MYKGHLKERREKRKEGRVKERKEGLKKKDK
jgi:hypothetical protein